MLGLFSASIPQFFKVLADKYNISSLGNSWQLFYNVYFYGNHFETDDWNIHKCLQLLYNITYLKS